MTKTESEHMLNELRKIIDEAKKGMITQKVYIIDQYQWIEFENGVPVRMGLTQDGQDVIKEFFKLGEQVLADQKKGKLATFMGVPIVVTDCMAEGRADS